MAADLESLSSPELETVLRFLLFHLDSDLRREMMGRHPVEYAKLFPSVDPAVIHSAVEIELRKVRFGQVRAVAAE